MDAGFQVEGEPRKGSQYFLSLLGVAESPATQAHLRMAE
jgi:hypothetical protein